MNDTRQICSCCVMDASVPDFYIDASGKCNYCYQFERIAADAPNDERGEKILHDLFAKIKIQQRNKRYDVLIGVSGGVDSMFLVDLAVKNGLRPLAVNFDNGWHSEIAVSNIKCCLEKLNVDLITYVVNYDEMKDLLLSYMKAGLPWADGPTDIAIVSTLYRVAAKFSIRFIFVGNNFRTEGKQPDLWTHTDSRQIRYIHRKFGTKPLTTFPNLSPYRLIYYSWFRGIKMIRPFYYIPYDKAAAKKMLQGTYGWRDYGGHHHESVFTKFVIAYWLPKKFNIDKRKVTLSAQVRSGLISRSDALSNLVLPPYDPDRMEEDKNYVMKKLGINQIRFREIWENPSHRVTDYPSYFLFYRKFRKVINFFFSKVFHFKPMMGYDL